jgi:hypothetical protein
MKIDLEQETLQKNSWPDYDYKTSITELRKVNQNKISQTNTFYIMSGIGGARSGLFCRGRFMNRPWGR